MDYDIGEAFQRIEDEMIASMSRNLKRHLSKEKEEDLNYSMWQAEQLKALDEFKRNNAEAFKDFFGIVNEQFGEVLKKCNQTGQLEQEAKILEAIMEGWQTTSKTAKGIQGTFFKINERKLNALIKATKSDMAKAETAMLRQANDVYRKTIYNAQVYYNTGAGTLSQCVDMATKDFLAKGITCVEYANGAMVGIDTYSRMVLRTTQLRSYLYGEAAKRDEWGINTVILNKRGNACPLCMKWVGQVYYDDVFGHVPIPSPEKYTRLSVAFAGGLGHPNCKDKHSTYFEGISTPPKPPTKEQIDEANRVYRLEQKQRYNERQIRKFKRLVQGSVDPDNVVKYSQKLQQWQDHQKAFIAQNGDVLKRRAELEKVFDLPENLQWGQNTYDFSKDIHGTIYEKHQELEKLLNSRGSSGKKTISSKKADITSLSDVEDYEDMASYMKKTYNADLDDMVRMLDFESVKEGVQGAERVMLEFPKAKTSLRKISVTYKGTMSSSYDGEMKFNMFDYRDRASAVSASQYEGIHRGSSVFSVGSHEAGHILEKALIDADLGEGYEGRLAWKGCTYAKKVVSDACKAAKKTAEGKGFVNDELIGQISEYAQGSESECLAEAVADYITNGENSAILSKKVWEILKKELG